MLILVSMGCGGSRSGTIEPRYYESRETESTWLTNTDTEITQLGTAGTNRNPAGAGESATEKENTAATGSDKREDKLMSASKSCSVKERKLVNAGTQCGRQLSHSTLTSSNQRRPVHREEVKNKSKKIPPAEVV